MDTGQYYARVILNRKPDLTNAQVRLVVLDKTDKMLTDAQIDKARTLAIRTIEVVGKSSEAILMSEGWLASEVKEIMGGLHTSIDSPWGLAWRKKRIDEIIYAETHGSSRKEFLDRIVRWYEIDHDRSPFEFLRAEYKPPQRVNRTQYKAAVQRRKIAMQTVKSLYPRKYPSVDRRKSHHKAGKY